MQISDTSTLALIVSVISALFSAIGLWYTSKKFVMDKHQFEIEREQERPIFQTYGSVEYIVEASQLQNQSMHPWLGKGVIHRKKGKNHYGHLKENEVLNLVGIRIMGFINISNLGSVPFYLSGLEVGFRLERDLPRWSPQRQNFGWSKIYPGIGYSEFVSSQSRFWTSLFYRRNHNKIEDLLGSYPINKTPRLNVKILEDNKKIIDFQEPIQILPKAEKTFTAIMDLEPDSVRIVTKSGFKFSALYSVIRFAGIRITKESKLDIGYFVDKQGEHLAPTDAYQIEWLLMPNQRAEKNEAG